MKGVELGLRVDSYLTRDGHPMPKPETLVNFSLAFLEGSSGCWDECHCGRSFFAPKGQWDWEDGELESLYDNPNATEVDDDSVCSLNFDGRKFCFDCNCWWDDATRYIRWIKRNFNNIERFLKSEES